MLNPLKNNKLDSKKIYSDDYKLRWMYKTPYGTFHVFADLDWHKCADMAAQFENYNQVVDSPVGKIHLAFATTDKIEKRY